MFKRTSNKQAALDNRQEFASAAVRIIKTKLVEHLVSGIKYEPVDDWYQMTLFEEEIPGWQDNLVPAANGLYDQISCDSEVERRFVAALDRNDSVKLYVKLPAWFTVPTPVGQYNPDWAIVKEERDEHGDGHDILYLVCETKSTTDRAKLRTDERLKIHCSEAHFEDALRVRYVVTPSVNGLP